MRTITRQLCPAASLMLLILCAAGLARAGEDEFGDPLPRGAVSRLGTLRHRYPPDMDFEGMAYPDAADEERFALSGREPIVVARSGDGLVAAGYYDGALVVWDEATGRKLHSLIGHVDDVRLLRFLRDGDLLISSSDDGAVRFWGPRKGRELGRCDLPDGAALTLEPAVGKEVLLIGGDVAWYRVGLDDYRPLDPGAGHVSGIELLAVSPDGRFIASSSGGRTILLWEASTGRLLRTLRGHHGDVTGLAFSPLTGRLASCDREGAVYLWSLEDGTKQRAKGRHYMRAFRAAYVPGTDFLVTGGIWKRLLLWNGADRGGYIYAHDHEDWEKQEVTALACSPSGRHVASAAKDARLQLHLIEDGSLICEAGPLAEVVTGISFSPDGRSLLSVDRGGNLAVRRSEDLHLEELRPGAWTAVAWSPDGSLIAAGDPAGRLHVLDAESLEPIARSDAHPGGLTTLAFFPDGRSLVTGGGEGTLLVYDVAALTGKVVGSPIRLPPRVTVPGDPGPRTPALARASASGLTQDESIRPYPGRLPTGDAEDRLSILILDGTTGRPLPGAEVRKHLEQDLGPPGRLLSGARTDGHGIAPVAQDPWDEQWVVDAKGFSAQSRLATKLPRETVLFPGAAVRGRLLDPFGGPASGARIELFVGCGHSPAIRSSTVGPDGFFRFHHVNNAQGRMLWFLRDGLASDYLEGWPVLDAGAGEEPHAYWTRPGVRMRGRIVDPDGTPVPGCRVHATNAYRGPWSISNEAGEFDLIGIDPGKEITFWDPDDEGGDRFAILEIPPPFARGIERVVVRTDPGLDLEDFEARHSVAFPVLVVDEETSKPVRGAAVALANPANGRWYWGIPDEEGEGALSLFLPEGDYLLAVGGPSAPFTEYGSSPVKVTVARDRKAPFRVRAWRQASLEIGGEFPEDDCSLILVVPGASREVVGLDDEEPVYLPLTGRAVMQVEFGNRTMAFPVGHCSGGRRRVEINVAGADEEVEEDEEDDDREPELVEIVVRAADGKFVSGADVRCWGSEESGIATEKHGTATGEGGRAFLPREPGEQLLVSVRQGNFVPRVLPVPEEGSLQVTWGDAALRLTVAGPDGEQPGGTLLLDGSLIDFEKGTAALLGLAPGRHTLVVDVPGFCPQELELLFPESAFREIHLILPSR